MQYLNSTFTIPPPEKVTCCEACVYGRGDHASFCTYLTRIRELSAQLHKWESEALTDILFGDGRQKLFDRLSKPSAKERR